MNLPPLTQKQLLIGGIGILAIAAIAASWFLFDRAPASPVAVEAELVATTTQPASITTPAKKPLPPEPAFVLPEGARQIDEYAFAEDGEVRFRSLTGKGAMTVPKADPDSFERITDFKTFTSGAVVKECGAAPIYAFYRDSRDLYFYQIWRAPEFRMSDVTIMVGSRQKDFTITGPTSFTDGKTNFTFDYVVSLPTCTLVLTQEPV